MERHGLDSWMPDQQAAPFFGVDRTGRPRAFTPPATQLGRLKERIAWRILDPVLDRRILPLRISRPLWALRNWLMMTRFDGER